MNKNTNPVVIGLLAGTAFCLMVALFNNLGMLVLIPVMLGALPIYVAALGWGGRAGIVATVVIVVFVALASELSAALLIAMTVAAPAALAGFQANLAQNDGREGGTLVWYPLSQILFWITLMIAAAIIVFGLMLDFDPVRLGPVITENFQSQLPEIEGRPGISMEEITRANVVILSMLPFLMPSIWIGIHVLNLLLGMRITRRLGVLARPPEDIADGLVLPKFSLALMIVVLVGTIMTSAPVNYVFSVGAGALTMAYSIAGLAAMHKAIRSWKTGRQQVLFLTYAMIIIFFIPIYLFSYAGILRTARNGTSGENKST